MKWFRQVERMEGENWAKRIMEQQGTGVKRVVRPRKRWWEVVSEDLRGRELSAAEIGHWLMAAGELVSLVLVDL